MSRNLGTDECCGIKVKLIDLVGSPLEFRKYADYRPQAGTKWVCPKCKKVYFVIIRSQYNYWGEDLKDQFDKRTITYTNGVKIANTNRGKFAKRNGDIVYELGYYTFDLSYYDTFNDEGNGVDTDNPYWLCTEDDEVTRL